MASPLEWAKVIAAHAVMFLRRPTGHSIKNYPRHGGWFLPSCDRPGPLGLASGHFSTQTVRRDSLLVVGITPPGNRDAGKFAADTTQLPTGCQPESLAKPARRRSHKATEPQLPTSRELDGRTRAAKAFDRL